jgi:hypothetical protein
VLFLQFQPCALGTQISQREQPELVEEHYEEYAHNMSDTTSSQNVAHGQQPVPSATSLWDRAYVNFSQKNQDLDQAFREILSTESAFSSGVLTSKNYADKEKQLSALVKTQVERMESREWKIKLGRKTIKIRKKVEEIIKILSAVKDFGTQAAALDPVHAGLPVAGLYLILSVCPFETTSGEP